MAAYARSRLTDFKLKGLVALLTVHLDQNHQGASGRVFYCLKNENRKSTMEEV